MIPIRPRPQVGVRLPDDQGLIALELRVIAFARGLQEVQGAAAAANHYLIEKYSDIMVIVQINNHKPNFYLFFIS
jgi:hypothetical protein